MRRQALITSATLMIVLLCCFETAAEQASDRYTPDIDPANFSSDIDNPFFPLVPGTEFVYSTPDGSERVEVLVTDQTRGVMGVECRVVESREYEDGELIELTYDWYAQDVDGAVWYFGEETRAYSSNGQETRAGSWEAGVDEALPGLMMPGDPAPGDPYLEEYYPGEAEDMGQIERVDGEVKVPYGTFTNVVVVREWTPLEPDVSEHKYYVRGVGLVLEDEGDVRLELVSSLLDAE